MRARELLPKVQVTFYFLTSHWTRPLRDSLEPLREAHALGMKNGDIESALYALSFECSFTFYSGARLDLVEEKYVALAEQLRLYKQTNALGLVLPYWQYLHNMTGNAANPKVLLGSTFGSDAIDPKNTIQLVVRCGLGADLAFSFEDFGLAQDLVNQRKTANAKNFASYTYAVFMLMDGLVAGAQIRMGKKRRRNFRILRQSLAQMTCWAKDCPQNFLHKQKLLEAELGASKHHTTIRESIVKLYNEAIEQGLREGFGQEATRACQLAGNYIERHGNHSMAVDYWTRAHGLYLEWGATTKASHLLKARLS